MQATQSSNASGMWRRDEQIAALPYMSQHLGVDADETPRRRREVEGVRDDEDEGSSLNHEAGELLSVLHLSSTILGSKGMTLESPSLRTELTELVDRSWLLLEHLLERSADDPGSREIPAGPLFLKPQIMSGEIRPGGSQVERRAAPGMLTEVHAEAGNRKRGMMLEETAAGWIAC